MQRIENVNNKESNVVEHLTNAQNITGAPSNTWCPQGDQSTLTQLPSGCQCTGKNALGQDRTYKQLVGSTFYKCA